MTKQFHRVLILLAVLAVLFIVASVSNAFDGGWAGAIRGATIMNDVETFVDEDATPDVTGNTYFNTNTSGATITDFDGDIYAGQIIVVVSKGAIVFDVTGSGLLGGTTNITTASGDVTVWMYDGTDWILLTFIDQSDDLS